MSLAKRIKFKVFPKLLKLSVFLNWPNGTAWLLAKSATHHNPSARPKVLVLRKSVFIDDVKAMAKYSGQINYKVIDREYFKIILYAYLKPRDKARLQTYNYYNHNYGLEGREKYYLYLKKMYPYLQKLIGFDALLCGNFDYLERQELTRVCQENNIPSIVLYKEGMVVQTYDERQKRLTKNDTFVGTKMMVSNEWIRETMLKVIKLNGLTDEKIKVVGVPRLDFYFKQAPQTLKQIVFFSFYPHDKLPKVFSDPAHIKEAEDRSAQFHAWVINFAKEYKDYQVIIKTKRSQHYLDYVKDIYQRNIDTSLSNLTITYAGYATDLIQPAKAVLGWNSTTLIEAIIADKPIISPYFGDLATSQDWDYFDGFPTLVNYAKTQAGLYEFLLGGQDYKYDQDQKNKFLKKYIHTPDGRASHRAEQEIIETVPHP